MLKKNYHFTRIIVDYLKSLNIVHVTYTYLPITITLNTFIST